jgi:hypothetical protein
MVQFSHYGSAVTDSDLPLDLRPSRLPRTTIAALTIGIVLAVSAAVVLDRTAPQFVSDYSMTAGVLAGALTVPVSLLLAVFLIDNARARQRALAWREFWGEVQGERLDHAVHALAAASQILDRTPSGTEDIGDQARRAVHWLPIVRSSIEVGTSYLVRYAETAQRPDLFKSVERLTETMARYAGVVEMYARERGDQTLRSGRDPEAELQHDVVIVDAEAANVLAGIKEVLRLVEVSVPK